MTPLPDYYTERTLTCEFNSINVSRNRHWTEESNVETIIEIVFSHYRATTTAVNIIVTSPPYY